MIKSCGGMPRKGAKMCRQFCFDKYFDNFLRNESQTRATVENDISKTYSQYPFAHGESADVNANDDFIARKFQEIMGRIKPVLKEKYQHNVVCPDQNDFAVDIIDEAVKIMAKDFCNQLKAIHKCGKMFKNN